MPTSQQKKVTPSKFRDMETANMLLSLKHHLPDGAGGPSPLVYQGTTNVVLATPMQGSLPVTNSYAARGATMLDEWDEEMVSKEIVAKEISSLLSDGVAATSASVASHTVARTRPTKKAIEIASESESEEDSDGELQKLLCYFT